MPTQSTAADIPAPSLASLDTLQQALHEVVAPWVRELDLRVVAATLGQVQLRLPVQPRHVHAGGVLCGQTLMAACDSAMVLAVMTQLGSFKPMSTVQLQTSFLRSIKGDAGEVALQARVLKMGKTLVFGDIEVIDHQGALAAHATTTYALL